MGYQKVSAYGVRHTIGGRTCLFLGEDGNYTQYDVSLEEARFLVDLLRNEEPIYLDPELKLISTSTEPIGEEEGGGRAG